VNEPDAGQQTLAGVQVGTKEGLAAAAQRLLERTIPNVPPSDPEHDPDPNVSLRDLGHVEEHDDGTVSVIFDGPYAAKIHEAQQFHHPRGGKAKFLEDELKAMLHDIPGLVAGEVHKHLSPRRRR
jgi:hypothetical protein